jgi:hypothetical protein
MMLVTKSVPTIIIPQICGKIIMNCRSFKLGQNTDSIHGFLSSLGMPLVCRELISTSGVQPKSLSRNIQRRFVKMRDVCRLHFSIDVIIGAFKRLVCTVDRAVKRTFGQWHVKNSRKNVRVPLIGYELRIHKVDRGGFRIGTILYGAINVLWKFSRMKHSTSACDYVGAILRHARTNLRKIKHLPRFMTDHCPPRHVASAEAFPFAPKKNHIIWFCHLLERRPWMSGLATGSPAAMAAQTLLRRVWSIFQIAITARGLVTVVAILGKAIFQCLYPLFQGPLPFFKKTKPLIQRFDKGDNSIDSLIINCADLVSAWKIKFIHFFDPSRSGGIIASC